MHVCIYISRYSLLSLYNDTCTHAFRARLGKPVSPTLSTAELPIVFCTELRLYGLPSVHFTVVFVPLTRRQSLLLVGVASDVLRRQDLSANSPFL